MISCKDTSGKGVASREFLRGDGGNHPTSTYLKGWVSKWVPEAEMRTLPV